MDPEKGSSISNQTSPSSSLYMEKAQNTFLEAYKTYSDHIFRFCLFKLSDREMAKDFMQETFAKTWVLMCKKDVEVKSLKAVLYKIAGNLIIDEYRRRGRRGVAQSLDVLQNEGFEISIDEGSSMTDQIDGGKALRLISKIQEPYAEAVFMRYVQGLELDEMAKITGASENTVSVRVHRGISILKKLFNKENV